MACWLLAAWTTLLWLASATGLDPSEQSIDLLETLPLHNNINVTYEPGHQQLRPAYYLRGDHRDLKLPPLAFQKVSDLLRRSSEFTISAWLRQETDNIGTIVSFAHGHNRYLELQSSGRKNEIRFHYTSQVDSKVYVETFPYRLADNVWHHVAISVSGWETELFVDCKSLYKRILKSGAPDRNFSVSQQLWLGQRDEHYHFKGAMQDVRLITGPLGYLTPCPNLGSTCPTCGQFSLLQNTVEELTRHLKELSERLVAAEGRISKVEECDCQKSCHVNGTVHADGARWQRGCDLCACVHGEIKCEPVECPVLKCKNPVNISGECCQICLRACLMHGQFFEHGDSFNVRACMECQCQDGNMKCTQINPNTTCPKLPCPEHMQISVAGECCRFCKDVDECQQEGGLDGHHCHLNTKCVNTVGSYKCECLPGYKRLNKFNCAELDECSSGEHRCDINANCINTEGSYHCVCQEGYTGDGYTCQPVCNQSCQNGGSCVKPGKCICRNGYTGESCAKDLDECATNLHRCTDSSVCVNMIGWYYCECKAGYYSPIENNILGALCHDIDECKMGIHTCHPSAQCVNTEGGFHCACPPERGNVCLLSCMFEGSEIEHGKTFSPSDKPCSRCTCNRGVITCDEPNCNCSLPGSNRNKCCPQCNPRFSCRHQVLTDVVLMHGERWSYDCEQCECEYGKYDCWEMKCPPLPCENPIKRDDECCPHCEDSCSSRNASESGKPCPFAGRLYKSGAPIVNPNDPCAACNCKDGMLCCSYNNRCNDDERAVGYDGVVAPAAIMARQSASVSGNKTSDSDVTKQYSAVLRVGNSSSGVVYVSDSVGGNKTEGSGG